MERHIFGALTVFLTLGLGFCLVISAIFDWYFLPLAGFIVGIGVLYFMGKRREDIRSKKEDRVFLKSWVATHTLLTYGLLATGGGTLLVAFHHRLPQFLVLMGYALTHTAYLVFLIFFTIYALHGGLGFEHHKKTKKN